MPGRSHAETGKLRQGQAEAGGMWLVSVGCWQVTPGHPSHQAWPLPQAALWKQLWPPPVTFPGPYQCLLATREPRLQPVSDADLGAGMQGSGAGRLRPPEPRCSCLSAWVVRMAASPGWPPLPASSPLCPPKHTEAPHSSKKLFLSFLNNVKMPREGLNQKPLQGPGWGGEGESRDGGSRSPEACGPV